jgi:hypothetical protein
LLLALAALALASRPWEQDSLAPGLRVAPDLGAAVDDAVAVARDGSVGLAAARVAPQDTTPVAAAVVAAPAPPSESAASAPESVEPPLAVSAARPVQEGAAVPISSPPPSPSPAPVAAAPEAAPAPAPASPQAPVPPLVAGGGGQGSPGTAAPVVPPEPECEGDRYLVTIGFADDSLPDDGSVPDEELPVEILIQRLEDDGTVGELHLEGDLGDANVLAELLAVEGNCVEVVLPPE